MEIWEKRFRLTYIGDCGIFKTVRWHQYVCSEFLCECWNKHLMRKYSFWDTKSCWCAIKVDRDCKYKLLDKSLMSTWWHIKERCFNKNNKSYKDYWWRWITVCEERLWKNWYCNFIKDMWYKPWKEYSIDRINNDWNYCKENCRRATPIEQWRNKRNTMKYLWKTSFEWAIFLWLTFSVCKSSFSAWLFPWRVKKFLNKCDKKLYKAINIFLWDAIWLL